MQLPRTSPRRIGVGAGLAGGLLALALATGVGPAPALSGTSSARGDDDSTTSSTATTSTTVAASAGAPAAVGTRVVDAAGAGTVTVTEAAGRLSLVSATPTAGWTVEVEQSAGPEVEVDFRRGAQRVQVNVELEDGAVRERVRFRDDATGTDVRFENGTIVGFESDDGGGVSGSDDSGDDATDDHGGVSGSDDGGDDATDDHGGDDGGGGSGRGGADDPPGDDHGTDD